MSIIPTGSSIQTRDTSISDQASKLGRLVAKKAFSVPNNQKESQFKAVAEQKKRTFKDCEFEETSTQIDGHSPHFMAMEKAWNRPEGHPSTNLENPMPMARFSGEIAPQVGCDRILMGTGAFGAEARLRLASGSTAGTEILLRATENGLEASVLITTEGARTAVSVAMSEMATRLRRRGHVVRLDENSPGRQKDKKHTRKDSLEE